MNRRHHTQEERWILWGIPVLFLTGSLLHFAYDALGRTFFAALAAPVNESVWEHGKMILWPMILWWSAYPLLRTGGREIPLERWFAGGLAALTGALLAMPLLYYFYTQAWGKELLWADILVLLLSLLAGQWLGRHLYRHCRGLPLPLTIAGFLLLILLFSLFTFFPPEIPWFQDGTDGTFGVPFPF